MEGHFHRTFHKAWSTKRCSWSHKRLSDIRSMWKQYLISATEWNSRNDSLFMIGAALKRPNLWSVHAATQRLGGFVPSDLTLLTTLGLYNQCPSSFSFNFTLKHPSFLWAFFSPYKRHAKNDRPFYLLRVKGFLYYIVCFGSSHDMVIIAAFILKTTIVVFQIFRLCSFHVITACRVERSCWSNCQCIYLSTW